LQSEGKLTRDFQVLFERFLDVAEIYLSSIELRAASRENKTPQQPQDELQNSYDRIVAAWTAGLHRTIAKLYSRFLGCS